jgi:hypothetical protein
MQMETQLIPRTTNVNQIEQNEISVQDDELQVGIEYYIEQGPDPNMNVKDALH